VCETRCGPTFVASLSGCERSAPGSDEVRRRRRAPIDGDWVSVGVPDGRQRKPTSARCRGFGGDGTPGIGRKARHRPGEALPAGHWKQCLVQSAGTRGMASEKNLPQVIRFIHDSGRGDRHRRQRTLVAEFHAMARAGRRRTSGVVSSRFPSGRSWRTPVLTNSNGRPAVGPVPPDGPVGVEKPKRLWRLADGWPGGVRWLRFVRAATAVRTVIDPSFE
jgi:hypothetical protein